MSDKEKTLEEEVERWTKAVKDRFKGKPFKPPDEKCTAIAIQEMHAMAKQYGDKSRMQWLEQTYGADRFLEKPQEDPMLKAAKKVKKVIEKEEDRPIQVGYFGGWTPVDLTRVSPFFPLSRKDRKEQRRIVGTLTRETPWGSITIWGEKLSVFDEGVLYAVLYLMDKQDSPTAITSFGEICRIMGIGRTGPNIKRIREALDRLMTTGVRTVMFRKLIRTGKQRQERPGLSSTIIATWSTGMTGHPTKEVEVTAGKYFYTIYGQGVITYLDLYLWSKLKTDFGKALYRFYQGQSSDYYSIGVDKLARTINIDMNLPMYEIRKRLRKGHAELRRVGYLTGWKITSQDLVQIWRTKESRRVRLKLIEGKNK